MELGEEAGPPCRVSMVSIYKPVRLEMAAPWNLPFVTEFHKTI